MTETYWICFEERSAKGDENPWKLLPYSLTKPDERRRQYVNEERAKLVLARLERLWGGWLRLWLLSRLPQNESFSQEVLDATMDEIAMEHGVFQHIQAIRQDARRVGLVPDTVIRIGYDADGGRMFYRGRNINLMPQVGAEWRPKDPRRVGSFRIKEVFETYVVGDDGRHVSTKRLVKRYQPSEPSPPETI